MAVKMEDEGNLGPQYILAFIVNMVSFTYGVMIGWLAPMQSHLQTNYTGTNLTSPLGEDVEPFTDEDISWIGGFYCIGGMLGTPLYGYLANALGRKKTTILAAIPFVIGFGLFLLASNAYYIFIARFIAGLAGGGCCVIVPMYIGETAQASVRGVLGSYFNLFICAGILCSFIIGSYTSYFVLNVFAFLCPLLFLVASVWLPETPIYSLLNGKPEEATASLLKLRGNNRDVVDNEMTNLTLTVKEITSNDESMSLGEMVSDAATRKALIIGGVLMIVQQFSGISPILNYTVSIFQASGSNLSPNLAAIVVGALQLIGAITGTIFMDRAGRKLLLLVSSVGMALTLAPIAAFFHLKSIGMDEKFMLSIGWIPVTSMAVYIVVFALGFGPVPFVLIAEIFKTEARSMGTSISVLLVWFFAFLLLKFFAKLQELIGIDACFAMFSFFCVLGAGFTYFYIPETKGKSLDMILWELSGKDGPCKFERSPPIPMVEMDEKMEISRFDFAPPNDANDNEHRTYTEPLQK